MAKFTVDNSTYPPLNMMLVSIFYQILMFIGYPILLGGFKLGDDTLALSGVGAKYFGRGEDADFILDDGHE